MVNGPELTIKRMSVGLIPEFPIFQDVANNGLVLSGNINVVGKFVAPKPAPFPFPP